ncbi:hypothetical protein AB0F72_08965 [Actinoplanes sp. NPDC023936]|uniref:hypothetical protein n=1 Tax=Actinoplanes sp. NPDC023936 TaxID=3154910 RepID=UPI0033D58A2A
MDTSTAIIVAALAAAASIIATLITSRVAKRANRTNELLEWARQLKASEQAARKEADESRERADRIRDEADQDVGRLRAEMDQLIEKFAAMRHQAERLTDTLTTVQTEVWRPKPDLDALRQLVGRPSTGINGR